MEGSWCGKDCGGCVKYADGACPGCRAGPGGAWSGECEVAACCRSMGHESCAECPFCGSCSKLGARSASGVRVPAAMPENVRENIPRLAKWLPVLFWLVIPTTVSAVLDILEVLPVLSSLLSIACSGVTLAVFFMLGGASPYFKKAAIALIVSVVLSALGLLGLSGEKLGFASVFALLTLAVSLYAKYCELYAYAAILGGTDDDLARKWRNVWPLFVVSLVVTLGSAFTVLISLGLFIALCLCGVVLLVVTAVLMLIYLWRTARIFGDLAAAGEYGG